MRTETHRHPAHRDMHVHTETQPQSRLYTCIHVNTRTHIDIHRHTSTYTHAHTTYMYVHARGHTETHNPYTRAQTHTCVRSHVHIYTHTCKYTHAHICSHTEMGGQEARKSSHLSSLSLPPAPANTCSAPGPGGIPSRRQASSSGQGPRHKHVGTEVRQAWPGMKSRDRASDKRHL